MQAFNEIRFPEDISYGMSGGPEYSTDIVETISGHEERNCNLPDARHRYNVVHGVKNKEQLDKLIAFFYNCKGKAIGFRFKDWTDYQAHKQLITIADGINCEFQLVKTYDYHGHQALRIINKPVIGTAIIYINQQELQEQPFLDYAKGIITFSEPPAKGSLITASFEFDVAVRFDTDRLSASIENYGSFSWYDIPLIEVRL